VNIEAVLETTSLVIYGRFLIVIVAEFVAGFRLLNNHSKYAAIKM
jgi:hypothetical protein